MDIQRKDCTFSGSSSSLTFQLFNVEYRESDDSAVIKLFGVTGEGYSAMALVYGFTPYFYVERNGKHPKEIWRLLYEQRPREFDVLIDITVENAQSILGYASPSDEFLKIRVTRQSVVSRVCYAMKTLGFQQTYESNVDPVVRFMIDAKLVGCCWVEITPHTYTIADSRTSRCQIEVETRPESIVGHLPTASCWNHTAPVRILSFDIEVAGRKGIFPQPTVDQVIQIASVLQAHGTESPFYQAVFVLNTCEPIEGVDIITCRTEVELLSSWAAFVRRSDPDVITGYNIDNFDFQYLLDRARALNVDSLAQLSRVKWSAARSHKGPGFIDKATTSISGRIVLDMFTVAKREHKLRSYTLNAVSEHFLGERKEDVRYTDISGLHAGDQSTRRTLAKYCLKDALLPIKLMNKWMTLTNYVEMARVTGLPVQMLASRGQQIKVFSLILREARAAGLIVPTLDANSAGTYSGGLVLEPQKGFHSEPIVVLDFSSLYPSIMIAYNLCYSTLLTELSAARPSAVNTTPTGAVFVARKLRKGILPQIVENLIEQRVITKQLLKSERDENLRRVYNGRQLALKITANAVYGFTGAQKGFLPCVQISESVTAYGRQIIEHAKKLVESHYSTTAGFAANATVVYGDTDSLMINFGVNCVQEAVGLGLEAAKFVTNEIAMHPLNLEFEKVFEPLLLMSKKRYVGLAYAGENASGVVDSRGIETNRRDNCELVADVVNSCLNKLLVEKNAEGAILHCRQVITDLTANRVDIAKLVITKELTNKKYRVKLPHTELSKKIAVRSPGTEPKLGDRVPYVILAGKRSTALHTRAEDPEYALRHKLPVDIDYYIKRQVMKPITRILAPIVGEDKLEDLLLGENKSTKRKRGTPGRQMRLEEFGVSAVMRCSREDMS